MIVELDCLGEATINRTFNAFYTHVISPRFNMTVKSFEVKTVIKKPSLEITGLNSVVIAPIAKTKLGPMAQGMRHIDLNTGDVRDEFEEGEPMIKDQNKIYHNQ